MKNIKHQIESARSRGACSALRQTARMDCLSIDSAKRIGAFTLVELLVVIAIIGVMVGLLTPAVQAMRESARQVTCQSNLTSISLALQSYHDRWLHFPVGTVAESGPIKSEANGNHHNWLGRLADLLDQPVIASRIDRSVGVYANANKPVLELIFPGIRCPSAIGVTHNASSYVGIHHSDEKMIDSSDFGSFVLNKKISLDDIADGLGNTAFVSEKLIRIDDLGWLSGTRATLRNVGQGIAIDVDEFADPAPEVVGSIGSRHPAGVHLLFGSGSIRFQSDQTDRRVLQQLADRRDGEIPLALQTLDQQREQNLE